MKNDTQTALTNYFNQQRASRVVIETVRESLAETFFVKLVARVVVVSIASAFFFLASPTAGFVALAIGIFIL